MHGARRAFLLIIGCAILIATLSPASAPQTFTAEARIAAPTTQGDSRTFPETGQTIASDFLTYWNEHGALAQQGYPISPEMQEVSEIDGKSYTVQYFERAKFEKHPEQADPANRVLLELFGVQEYRDRYPQANYPQGAPNQAADATPGSVLFEQTGKRLGGAFLQYWKTHGDVRQQGYPISDVFEEVAEDGKLYRVQYFERAKFELHTEFVGTANEVLLSRIGAKFVEKRYVKGGDWGLTPKPKAATPTAQPSPTPAPTQVVATPTPAEAPVEKVAGKEWFGGFKNQWGWQVPEKGKADLEKNLMLYVANQGKYGGSVADVENYIRSGNPIIEVDVPVYDKDVVGNYRNRAPSLVTWKTVQWDTRTPFGMKTGTAPGDYQIRLGGSADYVALVPGENNSLSYVTTFIYRPELSYAYASLSSYLWITLEIGTNIHKSSDYPKEVYKKTDYINVIFEQGRNNQYQSTLVKEDFLLNINYVMIGPNH